ncbi:MAG: hypothetical protein E6Q83_14095 [Thiothrix sp.]|nr:MAG: hypothetical protein E6Q83_14095 [Thiothrix sp.]
MNIYVLGTSNSIMQGNYTTALRQQHTVFNISVGRSPVLLHIKTLLDKKEEIEEGDLLIIDHYINDMMSYASDYGADYRVYVEDLYKLLSSLNINVINLLFPIKRYKKHKNHAYYHSIIELSKKYRITLLDLNNSAFVDSDFFNDTHLINEKSYEFGLWLSNELSQLEWRKPREGAVTQSPYTLLKIQSLGINRPVRHFYNSLVNINFLRIRETIELDTTELGDLIGFGYFRKDSSCDGLLINEVPIVTSYNGYFVDIFNKKFPATPKLVIKPLEIEGGFHCQNKFEFIQGQFKGAKLVELIFRKDSELLVKESKHYRVALNYVSPTSTEQPVSLLKP